MKKMMSRRAVLSSAVLGSCGLFVGCKMRSDGHSRLHEAVAPLSPVRMRQRWRPNEPQDIKVQFIKAVQWFKDNEGKQYPEGDPRSFLTWERFANIHEQSCYHGNWYIFPWHRHFVNYFEAACRIALNDPNFALPYWDWSQDLELPVEFFRDPILQRRRAVNEGEQLPADVISARSVGDILETQDFYDFYSSPEDYRNSFTGPEGGIGRLEAGPHNFIHNFIGNAMASPLSPADPIFWLHHSNIDRLWLEWQNTHAEIMPYVIGAPVIKNPAAPIDLRSLGRSNIASHPEVAETWKGHVLNLKFGGGQAQPDIVFDPEHKVKSSLSVLDILDVEKLGYTFEVLNPRKPAPVGKLAETPKLFSRSIIRGRMTQKQGWLSMHVDAMDPQWMGFLARPGQSRAAICLSNLKAPSDQELRRVLVIRLFALSGDLIPDLASLAAADAYKMEAYAGMLSFFAADHHQGQSPGVNFNTDITKKLKSWRQQQQSVSIQLLAVATDIRSQKLYSYFTDGHEVEMFLRVDTEG